MTQREKNKIKRDIRNLLEDSYEDDCNSYELEFRDMLENILDKWEEITSVHQRK